MAISPKQRQWVLGIALALTVAAVAFVRDRDGGEDGIVRPKKAGKAVQRREEEAVRLDRLKRPALAEDARDLFAAKSWHVEPPPRKIPEKPVAPPLPFVYIGKMIDAGGKVVVFLSRQGRIYTVSEGDAIDRTYRVDSVRAPTMTLTYLPLETRQTLQIGEAN